MSFEQAINEHMATLDSLKEAYVVKGKSVIKEMLQEFFKENPDVHMIYWLQYTPYFNDGDACVFSVNDICVSDKDLDVDQLSDWIHEHNWKDETSWKLNDEKVNTDLRKLNTLFGAHSETLEELFGDHCSVVCYRDGEIHIEEYEHD